MAAYNPFRSGGSWRRRVQRRAVPAAGADPSKLSPLVASLFNPADDILRALEPRILLDASIGAAAVGVADAVDDRADEGEGDKPITAVVERNEREEQKNKRSRRAVELAVEDVQGQGPVVVGAGDGSSGNPYQVRVPVNTPHGTVLTFKLSAAEVAAGYTIKSQDVTPLADVNEYNMQFVLNGDEVSLQWGADAPVVDTPRVITLVMSAAGESDKTIYFKLGVVSGRDESRSAIGGGRGTSGNPMIFNMVVNAVSPFRAISNRFLTVVSRDDSALAPENRDAVKFRRVGNQMQLQWIPSGDEVVDEARIAIFTIKDSNDIERIIYVSVEALAPGPAAPQIDGLASSAPGAFADDGGGSRGSGANPIIIKVPVDYRSPAILYTTRAPPKDGWGDGVRLVSKTRGGLGSQNWDAIDFVVVDGTLIVRWVPKGDEVVATAEEAIARVRQLAVNGNDNYNLQFAVEFTEPAGPSPKIPSGDISDNIILVEDDDRDSTEGNSIRVFYHDRIAADKVLAVVTIREENANWDGMTIGGFRLKRLGASYDYAIYTTAEITDDEVTQALTLTDNDGNAVTINLKLVKDNSAPTPSLPTSMPTDTRESLSVGARTGVGQYSVVVPEIGFLNPYANTEISGELPVILEFDLSGDIFSGWGKPPRLELKTGEGYLQADVFMDGDKIKIRMDKTAAAELRTISVERNKIGFTITATDGSVSLDIIVFYTFAPEITAVETAERQADVTTYEIDPDLGVREVDDGDGVTGNSIIVGGAYEFIAANKVLAIFTIVDDDEVWLDAASAAKGFHLERVGDSDKYKLITTKKIESGLFTTLTITDADSNEVPVKVDVRFLSLTARGDPIGAVKLKEGAVPIALPSALKGLVVAGDNPGEFKIITDFAAFNAYANTEVNGQLPTILVFDWNSIIARQIVDSLVTASAAANGNKYLDASSQSRDGVEENIGMGSAARSLRTVSGSRDRILLTVTDGASTPLEITVIFEHPKLSYALSATQPKGTNFLAQDVTASGAAANAKSWIINYKDGTNLDGTSSPIDLFSLDLVKSIIGRDGDYELVLTGDPGFNMVRSGDKFMLQFTDNIATSSGRRVVTIVERVRGGSETSGARITLTIRFSIKEADYFDGLPYSGVPQTFQLGRSDGAAISVVARGANDPIDEVTFRVTTSDGSLALPAGQSSQLLAQLVLPASGFRRISSPGSLNVRAGTEAGALQIWQVRDLPAGGGRYSVTVMDFRTQVRITYFLEVVDDSAPAPPPLSIDDLRGHGAVEVGAGDGGQATPYQVKVPVNTPHGTLLTFRLSETDAISYAIKNQDVTPLTNANEHNMRFVLDGDEVSLLWGADNPVVDGPKVITLTLSIPGKADTTIHFSLEIAAVTAAPPQIEGLASSAPGPVVDTGSGTKGLHGLFTPPNPIIIKMPLGYPATDISFEHLSITDISISGAPDLSAFAAENRDAIELVLVNDILTLRWKPSGDEVAESAKSIIMGIEGKAPDGSDLLAILRVNLEIVKAPALKISGDDISDNIVSVEDDDRDGTEGNTIKVLYRDRIAADKVLAVVTIREENADWDGMTISGFRLKRLGTSYDYAIYTTAEITDDEVTQVLTLTDNDNNAVTINLKFVKSNLPPPLSLPDDMAAGPKSEATIEAVDANTWRIVADIDNLNAYANEKTPHGDVTGDNELPTILEFDLSGESLAGWGDRPRLELKTGEGYLEVDLFKDGDKIKVRMNREVTDEEQRTISAMRSKIAFTITAMDGSDPLEIVVVYDYGDAEVTRVEIPGAVAVTDGTGAYDDPFVVTVPADVVTGGLVAVYGSSSASGSVQTGGDQVLETMFGADFTALADANEPYFRFVIRDGVLWLDRIEGETPKSSLQVDAARTISVGVVKANGEVGKVSFTLQVTAASVDRVPAFVQYEHPDNLVAHVWGALLDSDEVVAAADLIVTDTSNDNIDGNHMKVDIKGTSIAAGKAFLVIAINDDGVLTLDSVSEAAGFRFEKLPGPNYYYKLYSIEEIDRGVKRTLTITDADGNSLSIDLTIYLNGIVDLASLSTGAKPTLSDDMAAGPKADTTIEVVDANTWRVVTDIGNFNKYANEQAPYGDVTGDGNLPFILEFDPNDFISGVPSSFLTFADGDGTALTKVNGKWRLRLDSSKSLSQRVIADGTSITITVSGTTGDDSVLTEEFTIEFKQAVKLVYSNALSLDSRVVAMEVTDPRIHKYNERHWDVYYDSANPPEGSSSNQIRLFHLSGFRQFPRDGAGASSNSWGAKGSGGLEASNSILLDLALLRESLIRLNKRADQVAPGEGVVTFTLGTGVARGAQLKIFVNFKPFPYYAIPDTDQPAITDPDDGSRFLEVSSQDIDTRSWVLANSLGTLSVTPGSPPPIIHLDLGSGTFVEDPGRSNPDRSDDFFTLSAGSDGDGDGVFRYTISLNKNLGSGEGTRGLRLRDPETGLVITLNIQVQKGLQALDWQTVGPMIFDSSGGKDGSRNNPYKLTVPADVAIGDLLTFKTSGGAEFTPDQEFDTIDANNRQYFTLVTRDGRGTAVLQRISGDGGALTPASSRIVIVVGAGSGATDPPARNIYINLQIVAAAADRAPKFIGAAESSQSYTDGTTIAVPSASTVSEVDSDDDGEVDTVRVESTATSIAANEVIAIIIVDDDSDMTLTAPSGYTLSRLGPSYRYSLTANADITGGTSLTLKLQDGDGNALEIKLEISLGAIDPVITSEDAQPTLPDDMLRGPKEDATIKRVAPAGGSIEPNANEGVWQVITDRGNLNKYANELAPYGDENGDPDTLPYILEFDRSLFTAALPYLTGFTVVTVDPVDGGTDPKDSSHLKVIVVKDLAGNKLRIRLDKNALAALRTISASRNTIEFEVQDSRDASKKLTITITYEPLPRQFLYSRTPDAFAAGGLNFGLSGINIFGHIQYTTAVDGEDIQPLYSSYSVEVTDRRIHKYNEKVWDVYYDPTNPPVGALDRELPLYAFGHGIQEYYDAQNFAIVISDKTQGVLSTEYSSYTVVTLVGRPGSQGASAAFVYQQVFYAIQPDGSVIKGVIPGGAILTMRVNLKPLPYHPPAADQQPDVGGGKFAELPLAPRLRFDQNERSTIPFNEKRWRLIKDDGQIAVTTTPVPILHLDLGRKDFAEVTGDDTGDYFEVVAPAEDDVADGNGNYRYKIRLKRNLMVSDGVKYMVLKEPESGLEIKLRFDVKYPDMVVGAPQAEGPVERGSGDGSRASPYAMTAPANVLIGNLMSFALSVGSNYRIVAFDLDALDDNNEDYFQFAIEDGKLVLKRISGSAPKATLDIDDARAISVTIGGDGVEEKTVYLTLEITAIPGDRAPVIAGVATPAASLGVAPASIDAGITASDPDSRAPEGDSVLVVTTGAQIDANKVLAVLTINDDDTMDLDSNLKAQGYILNRIGTSYRYALSYDKAITRGISGSLILEDGDGNQLTISFEVELAPKDLTLASGAQPTLPSDMPSGPKADASIDAGVSSTGAMSYTITTDISNLNNYANEMAPYGEVTGDGEYPYILEFDLSQVIAAVSIGELLIRAKSVDAAAAADNDYLQAQVFLDPNQDNRVIIRMDKTAAEALRTISAGGRHKIEFTIRDPRSILSDPKEFTITIVYRQGVELGYSVPASGQPVDSEFYAAEAATDPKENQYNEKVWDIYYDPSSPPDGSSTAINLFKIDVTASDSTLRIRSTTPTQNDITLGKSGDTYTIQLVGTITGDVSKSFIIVEEDASGQATGAEIKLTINFKSLAYFDSIPYSLAGITQPSLNGERFAELPQTPDTPNNERTWRLTNSNGRLGVLAGILRLDLPSDTFVEELDGDPDNYLRLRRVSSSDSGGKYRYVIQLRKTLSDTDGTKSIVLRDTATGFEIKILVEVKKAVAVSGGQAEDGVTLDTSGGKDGSTTAKAYGVKAKVDVDVGDLVSFALGGGSNYRVISSALGALHRANEGYFQFAVENNKLVLKRITGRPAKDRLTDDIARTITVTVGGDGVADTTFHFTLEVGQLPSVTVSSGQADDSEVTLDTSGDKDGSTTAKAYGVQVKVDVAVGELMSFILLGGYNYKIISSVLTALHDDNEGYFQFAIDKGRLVLKRITGSPAKASLTAEPARTITVTVSGADLADTTFYFTLEVGELPSVTVSGGRADGSEMVLDASGGKDGSTTAKAYGVKVKMDVAVGDLVSFALSGGSNYRVISSALTALHDDNEDYFQFAIDKGRLVLKRITGSPAKASLTAEPARTITVTVGGYGAADTIFHFTLEVGQPVTVSEEQEEDSKVVLDTSGGKDGSTTAKAYGVQVKMDVAVGDLVSFALGGGSNYKIISSVLTALHDDNEDYFQFAVENNKLVLKRITGSPPKASLTAAPARTLTVTVGGDGVEDTTFHFTVEIGQLVTVSGGRAEDGVTLDTSGGKDGITTAKAYGVKVKVDVGVGDLVSFALGGGSNYRVISSVLTALHNDNEDYFQFAFEKGRLVLKRITGSPAKDRLTADKARKITVTVGGDDDVVDTTVHFTLEVEQLPSVTVSGGQAEDGVTLDTSGGKDGITTAKAYGVKVKVDVAVGDLVSFTLGGGSNYRVISSVLTALHDDNEGYFQFAVENNKLVLKRIAGSPSKDRLTAAPARTIAVTVGGDDVADTIFYFALEVEQLPSVTVSGRQADDPEVTLDASGDKDGSAAVKAYGVKAKVDVGVGDLVSFTLGGGSNYKVISSALGALHDDNEGYFQFAFENNKLVLKRIAGSSAKDRLTADTARTITVTVGGDDVADTIFYFALEVEQLPSVTVSGGQVDGSEVTLDASGGKDGSTTAKAYGVKVKIDVAAGDLVSFALGGGSDYRVISSALTALHDDNEGYFQFAFENGKLVLKRITGDPPKASLTADAARTITVTVGGDDVADTTFHFTLEVGLPVTVAGGRADDSEVTLDASGGKDGSETAKAYGVKVKVDVAVGDLVSFALGGGSNYSVSSSVLTALNDANEGYFQFAVENGRLVLKRITGDPVKASLTADAARRITVTVGGDGVADTIFHFTLEVEQLLSVTVSDEQAEDSEVTLDTSGGKDGSETAKAYGVKVKVDVAVGDLVSFALGGGSNYSVSSSVLTALNDANEGYFQFAFENNKLVLKRITGNPAKARLTADPARTLTVTVGGYGVADTTFHFTLEVEQLLSVTVFDEQAEDSEVTLDTSGGKDGSETAKAYGVKVKVDVAVGDLVSFTLGGGSNYRVISSALGALHDDNEDYFHFAFENNKLVLKRITGNPAKARLTADTARTLTVTVGGYGVADTTFHFTLEVEQLLSVTVSGERADNDEVTLDASGGKDGSTTAKAYGVQVKMDVAVGDLVSFALSGGSSYSDFFRPHRPARRQRGLLPIRH